MKQKIFVAALCISFLVGCTAPAEPVKTVDKELPAVVALSQQEPVIIETEPMPKQIEMATENPATQKFFGKAFSIEYPANFLVTPTGPMVEDNDNLVNTDEAWFESPEKNVEFYVYAPTFGEVDGRREFPQFPTEIILDESEETIEEPGAVTTIRHFTVADKNAVYYRSYIEYSKSPVLYRLAIKFSDQAAYDQYADQFDAFKKSLRMFIQ